MPGQVGDLPHDTGKLLMWRRPPACVADRPNETGIFSHLLIRKMSRENPLWGASRIHGELLKLGIDIGETSVSLSRSTSSPC
jgi:hypothetical protein